MTTSPRNPAPEAGPALRTGGRVELRRREPDPNLESIPHDRGVLVAYEARWTTPHGTWTGELFMSSEGKVSSHLDGEGPPSWLADFTSQLLRATARSAAGADPADWPRRITRWRAAPEER